MRITRKPNFTLLAQQLANAGFAPLGVLGHCVDEKNEEYEVYTLDAQGEKIDLPVEAQSVVDAHTPPPPPSKIDVGAEVPDDQDTRLANVVKGLRTFLDNPSPGNAAVLTALKATIRLLLFLLKRQGF